ncbi:mycothiol synthase [Gordonia sp. X0973]|uniref:mycothiol synthase n=1 Tax=Gordonia sp. X0973 TaxID=2742602 RepID=UPI000F542F34|nr:mycothiol synthase [Gordonia sp. X0973]QKT06332.1 mycothiol synthase [Gordonia sp. X0973]
MTSIARAEQLSDEQQRAVRAVLVQSHSADGVQALGEAPVNALGATSPAVEHLLATADDGTVIGYASVLPGRDGEPSTAELVVAPAARGNGVGRSLAQRVLATAPTAGVRLWAHGDLPAARALAGQLGLSVRRELRQLNLGVGADDEPLPPLPQRDDVVLRTYAGPADDREILRVNNAAFDWHPEQGGWTQEQIVERTGADWFDPRGLFLAFDRDDAQRLLGFHWTKVASPELGEVYVVGVDPAAQGRGLGRLLTLAGLHYLAGRVPEVTLYVEGDNTAALHTYENLGFEPFRVDVAYG